MSETPTIPPALSAEEWGEVQSWGDSDRRRLLADACYAADLADIGRPKPSHALAALCLYGQPFGFTAEDVAVLKQLSADKAATFRKIGLEWCLRESDALASLASRIAALLPPEPLR